VTVKSSVFVPDGDDTQALPSRAAVFDLYESEVRSYSRTFPVVFLQAEGSYMSDRDGRRWLDFLSGAGSLNYGHNHPALKKALLDYMADNGVVNSLDLYTSAKEDFLTIFNNVILRPRGLSYKCQFCGPTGTNVVEAALKLARKYTKRKNIISFSNSYHGMSAGSMSVSALLRRGGAFANGSSESVTFLPFDGFTGLKDETAFIRKLLTATGSGIAPPAAFIVELVQGEGGVNVASTDWVTEIYRLAKEIGALFIVDDIQAGCGRTGKFFSFEHHGIAPDIVCLSKSISGFGLPMSLMLMSPNCDVWEAGEHTGTFRGFAYSYVTAMAAIRQFWAEGEFQGELRQLCEQLNSLLRRLKGKYSQQISEIRKKGMFSGIQVTSAELARKIQRDCFSQGLIVEICGASSNTLKLLPPLTVSAAELDFGISVIDDAFRRS
jgi:diaminobutyrate-2-oxoglutarate transaminase